MTIENLINLIDAKLVNEPKVNKVEAATIYPSKVDMGDLFFALDKEDITKAVDNGAYAIVYEGSLDIIANLDSEVAYLQVESMQKASLKFLRYVAIQKKVKIYHLESVELSLLKQIVSKNSIVSILPNDFKKSFESVVNSDYEIFVTTNEDMAKTIDSNYKTIEPDIDGYIVDDTLLRSTFRIEKFFYQDMELSPIFFDNLRSVVSFCSRQSIGYNINRIKYTKEFKPYYINNKLEVTPKASSEKVAIFIDSLKNIVKAHNYLREQTSWTKSIVLTPVKTKVDIRDNPIWYNDYTHAREILKSSFYNFAFCYQVDAKDVLNFEENQPKLFS